MLVSFLCEIVLQVTWILWAFSVTFFQLWKYFRQNRLPVQGGKIGQTCLLGSLNNTQDLPHFTYLCCELFHEKCFRKHYLTNSTLVSSVAFCHWLRICLIWFSAGKRVFQMCWEPWNLCASVPNSNSSGCANLPITSTWILHPQQHWWRYFHSFTIINEKREGKSDAFIL